MIQLITNTRIILARYVIYKQDAYALKNIQQAQKKLKKSSL